MGTKVVCLIGETAQELETSLSALAPTAVILSIYGLNNKHWAWVRVEAEQPKPVEKPRKLRK